MGAGLFHGMPSGLATGRLYFVRSGTRLRKFLLHNSVKSNKLGGKPRPNVLRPVSFDALCAKFFDAYARELRMQLTVLNNDRPTKSRRRPDKEIP